MLWQVWCLALSQVCTAHRCTVSQHHPHRKARQPIEVCRTEQRTVAHWLALPVGLIEVASPQGSEVREALHPLPVRHRSRHGHIASSDACAYMSSAILLYTFTSLTEGVPGGTLLGRTQRHGSTARALLPAGLTRTRVRSRVQAMR